MRSHTYLEEIQMLNHNKVWGAHARYTRGGLGGEARPDMKDMSDQDKKDISCRAGDIPKFVGFHKGSMPTTRLTHTQKYKKLRIIWNQCTSVQ